MKFESFLIVLIFNWVLWTFVKTVPTRKSLARQVEKDDVNKILNDGAESSVNPQIQNYKETLKPKLKITKKGKNTSIGDDKLLERNEYNKEYYQKNKERLLEYKQNYRKQNKEKITGQQRNYHIKNKEKNCQSMKIYYQNNKENLKNRRKIYYQKNKEKINEYQKMYDKNNREKINEYRRICRQKKKNAPQSSNNEGTSSVNPQNGDDTNKDKLPIVCEENFEEGNLLNEGEGESNNAENKKNQDQVEEPNKIDEDNTNQIEDSNKKVHPFDLNEKPKQNAWEIIKNNGFFSLSNPLHSIFKFP